MRNNILSTRRLSGLLTNHAPEIALTLLWRAIQVMVIFPAAIMGLFLAVGILTNSVKTQDIVQGIYNYPKLHGPARPGFVSRRECADTLVSEPRAPSTQYPGPLTCQSWRVVEVLIAEQVANDVASLHVVYGSLVIFSFFCALIFIYPGRRFVGLPHPNRDFI